MKTRATLLTFAALLIGAPPASAIMSVQKFTAAASSNVAGTRSKPRPIALKVRAYFEDISPDLDRGVQFATARATIYFPRDGITNARRFPSCSTTTIQADEKRCPSGSRVGTGNARGIGLGLDENVKVTIFNAPKGDGVSLLIVGESPLIIREVVSGRLTRTSGDRRYGLKLQFAVPGNLQSPAPGVIAAVKEIRTSVPVQYLRRRGKYVKSKGRRIPYLATTGCTGGDWYIKFVAEYTTSYDGAIESSQTVEATQPCWRAGER